MEPLNKEQQSANVKERLNKEEMYARYGAYAPADAVDRYNGKAAKPRQPYELSPLPGVPEESRDEFMLMQVGRTPEQNARSIDLLNFYSKRDAELWQAQEYARSRPYEDYYEQAGITHSNIDIINRSAENLPLYYGKLSRKGAAQLVKYNLQKDPTKEAAYVEAKARLGAAAKLYNTPDDVVQQSEANMLYTQYYEPLKKSKISLAFLASSIGRAMTPEDYKIAGELWLEQDSRANIVADATFFTQASRIQTHLNELFAQMRDGTLSEEEYFVAVKIYSDMFAKRNWLTSMISSVDKGVYDFFTKPANLFDQESIAYESGHAQTLRNLANENVNAGNELMGHWGEALMLSDPSVQRNLSAYGLIKGLDTLNYKQELERMQNDYALAAIKSGKDINEIIAEDKERFDTRLAWAGVETVATIATPLATKGIMMGGKAAMTALPALDRFATNYVTSRVTTKAGMAAVMGATELGADVVASTMLTAPSEGAISASVHESKQDLGLKSEYDTAAAAYGWGILNNFVENAAGGVFFDSPFLAKNMVNWYRTASDIKALDEFDAQAQKVAQLSTAKTAPQATEEAVTEVLQSQGYEEKLVYFAPEDLRDIVRDTDLSWLNDRQREALFADLDGKLERGDYTALSAQQMGTLFADTPIYQRLTEIERRSTTAVSRDEAAYMTDARRQYLEELFKKYPDMAINTAQEREAAKTRVFHETEEKIVSVLHNRMGQLGNEKINTTELTNLAREMSSVLMSLAKEFDLPQAEIDKFVNDRLPTFEGLETTLDIRSGRAADKTRGTYNPETNTIALTKDANVTDLFHEVAHFWLDTTMRLADDHVDNANLGRIRDALYSGYVNEDPQIKTKRWADLDPALKTRMQETFVHEYIKTRATRAFTKGDYTAENALDEKGNKIGRTHVVNAHFGRTLARAFAQFYGRDLRGKKDPEIYAEVQEAAKMYDAAFQKDYGISEIPESMKELISLFDLRTGGFIDQHRIANMYPIGSEFVLKDPNASPEEMALHSQTHDAIMDEHHSQVMMLSAALVGDMNKNADTIYKMRKEDIEKNPEYKRMLEDIARYEDELDARKKDADNVEGQLVQLNTQLNGLKIKRATINTAEYRKERGALKRRTTHIAKTVEENNQKLLETGEKAAANELEFIATRTQNNINREAYEAAQAATASKREDLAKAIEDHERYKQLREDTAKKVAEGTEDKESLKIAQRMAKNQGDVVRRARTRLAELEKREQAAFDAFNESATKEAMLRETHNQLMAEIEELRNTNVTLGDEFVDKQGTLEIDPVADIDAEIDSIKSEIKLSRSELKDMRANARTAEKNLNRVKRQYKDAEANYTRELKALNDMYGTKEQQREAIKKQIAYNLDNGKDRLGEEFQDALNWKKELEGKDQSDPIWNDALDYFGVGDVESLRDLLDKRTNREQLINDIADQMMTYREAQQDTSEAMVAMSFKTAAKIIRADLNFLEGRLSKSSRLAKQIIKRTAGFYRANAASLRFSNTSPDQLLHRAEVARNQAQRILTHPEKYDSIDAMYEDAYNKIVDAELFVQLAQTATRMKNQAQKELRQVVGKLNAKGVSDRINATHVQAAKTLLVRMGVIRGQSAPTILKAIARDFPEQYLPVAKFFDGTENQVQHYTQMQLGDIFAMVDLIKRVTHDGEQVLANRKAAQNMRFSQNAQAVIDAMNPIFEGNKALATQRDAADAVNEPDKNQLTGWDKWKRKMRSMRNRTLTMQAVSEYLDGSENGAFKRTFFDGVAEANNQYILAERKLAEEMQASFESARPLFDPHANDAPDLNDVVHLTGIDGKDVPIKPAPDGNIRKGLFGILIHIGNDSNFNALCRSMNVEPDVMVQKIRELEEKGIINEALMDHVQAYWDKYKEIGLQAQDAYNKINNRFYKPVGARKVVMCGKTYAGGYAPLTRKRDVLNADATLAEQLNDAAHDLPPSYDPNFAQERSNSSALPLDLTYDGVLNGLSRQLRYAKIMPALNDLHLFVKANPEMMRQIEIVLPGFKDEIFDPWMRAVANQSSSDIKVDDWISTVAQVGARVNQSIMAGNLSNAAQQLTGFIVATAKVSPGHLLKAIAMPMKRSDIFEKSAYMRARIENNKKNMSALRRDLRDYKKGWRALHWLDDHSYILQTIIQNWVDTRVWSAKYEQALAKHGDPAQAAIDADQAIRMTMGSFNVVDSSAFDRDPVSKLIVPFMNYFQSMTNLWTARVGQLNRGQQNKVRRAFNGVMVGAQVMIIPSIVSYFIAQTVKGAWFDAEEEDVQGMMLEAGSSAVIGSISGFSPMLAASATFGLNLALEKPTNDSMVSSPVAVLIPNAIKSSWRLVEAMINGDDIRQYDMANVARVFVGMGILPGLGMAATQRAFVAYALATDMAETDDDLAGVTDVTRALVTGTLSEAQKGNR